MFLSSYVVIDGDTGRACATVCARVAHADVHGRTTNAVASLVAAGSPDATMRPNLAQTATISRSTESQQPAEESSDGNEEEGRQQA
jgi:hypothetical protein